MKKYRVDLVSHTFVIVEASSEDKAIELAEDFATYNPHCYHSFEYDDGFEEVNDSEEADVSENDF